MRVVICLEYYGEYKRQTGKKNEELIVSSALAEAYPQIMSHIEAAYGLIPPFVMMMGKTHIAGVLKYHADEPLKDGTVFKFMPSISGG